MMITRSEIAKTWDAPKLLRDPSFERHTFVRDFSEMMLSAIYQKNGWPIDPALWLIGGGEDTVSILDPQRLVALYGYDLGPGSRGTEEMRMHYLEIASGSKDGAAAGLIRELLLVGATTILVRDEPKLPTPAEVCEMRLVAWYLARLKSSESRLPDAQVSSQ